MFNLNYSSANFQPLTLETLRHSVPSIFTEVSAEHTSAKYQHISTSNVLDGLIKEGFLPVYATQCRCRNIEKRPYTKHLLRFRHVSTQPTVDGLFPEIALINSHDGCSAYRIMAGIFRLVCRNGMLAGNNYQEVHIRHQGDIVGNVIEGTYEVVKNSEKMLGKAEEMKAIELEPSERLLLAESAHSIRFDDNPVGEAFQPARFLIPRRYEEMKKNDLFTVFNVIQENIMKGGIRGMTTDKRGYSKATSTRAIKSIDQNTALNRALWTLAEKMLELKRQ